MSVTSGRHRKLPKSDGRPPRCSQRDRVQLRSSVINGRPYSDCTVYYYFYFSHFCPDDFSEMTRQISLKFTGQIFYDMNFIHFFLFLKIHFRSRDTDDFRFFMSTLFLRNYKRQSHQIFRDDRSYLVDVHNEDKHVVRHFRSSQEVIVEVEIFKISILSLNLYQLIKSLLQFQIILVRPETDLSTSGKSSKNFSFS